MKWQWLEDVHGTVAQDPSPEGRQAYRDFYRKGLELTGAAHRAGVRILAGTDYIVPGADLHRELAQLVAAGLSPAEALRTATRNPARYFGLESEYGSVDPGKVADLILLEADPLVDIRNTQRIRAVVFNGNVYDREALDGLRARVRKRARSWSVACKILWRFLQQPVNY
jgi:imidazolonepropionase-like amidohydrolase